MNQSVIPPYQTEDKVLAQSSVQKTTVNPYQTEGKVAILIDGGFFLKRLHTMTDPVNCENVDYIIKMIRTLCFNHASRLNQQIYRVFFYDCPPFEKGLHNPLTKKFIDFKKQPQYKFKIDLFNKLKNLRKMALRLGCLNDNSICRWQIIPQKVNDLLHGKIKFEDLDPEKDIVPNLRQKQVDMKIGVDITSMVLKKQVSTIVLVAGDGDFVPASKLARREGVDFILDPMWAHINPDLNEHIDGIYSGLGLFRKNQHEKSSEVEQQLNDF